jgi:protein TonB
VKKLALISIGLLLALLSYGQKTGARTKPEPVYDMNDVDTQPMYPGGLVALAQFFKNNLHLPADSNNTDPELSFIVEKNGQVLNLKVVRSGKNYEDAAKELQRQMPNWSPGKKNGKAVKVRYHIAPHLSK